MRGCQEGPPQVTDAQEAWKSREPWLPSLHKVHARAEVLAGKFSREDTHAGAKKGMGKEWEKNGHRGASACRGPDP